MNHLTNILLGYCFSHVQCCRITSDKTRQGYARKRTLKLAGYSFNGGVQ